MKLYKKSSSNITNSISPNPVIILLYATVYRIMTSCNNMKHFKCWTMLTHVAPFSTCCGVLDCTWSHGLTESWRNKYHLTKAIYIFTPCCCTVCSSLVTAPPPLKSPDKWRVVIHMEEMNVTVMFCLCVCLRFPVWITDKRFNISKMTTIST